MKDLQKREKLDSSSWDKKYRPILKNEFWELGIISCQLKFIGCKSSAFLSFAHSLPRRDIYNEKEMKEVILTCNNCHGIIEGNIFDKQRDKFWSRAEMFEIVNKIREQSGLNE